MDSVDPLEKRRLVERGGSGAREEQGLGRRFLEAFVNRNLDTIEELLAPHLYRPQLAASPGTNREELERW